MSAKRRSWTIEHPVRPLPENELRKLYKNRRWEYVAGWRFDFKRLSKGKRIPKLEQAIVTVSQVCRRGTTLPDAGANFNTAKAAIDGLVDAGVLVNDDPKHLLAIVLVAPVHGDRDAFLLTIEEQPSEGVDAL